MNAPIPRNRASFSERHQPLNLALADSLREAIMSGRYPPGDRLVEERLAEDFGVSRIPVREALRVLAAEGLVTIEPRKGATVASLTAATAHEMVEVRATLEALNARLAARHRDPNLIARLEAVLREGEQAATAGSAQDLARLNNEYHELLAEAGMNRILGDMMRSLRERTAAYFGVPVAVAAGTWVEHADILKAVIAGDETRAAQLAERHVAESARRERNGGRTNE
jgi:DNA-binding GntR family transcriptional regulator